ncbi:MAG: hypothetical protein JJU45_15235 [Acidimicrobiia bacterium]|nr:hypothetical protein [Acidimicrobiia bacterium]
MTDGEDWDDLAETMGQLTPENSAKVVKYSRHILRSQSRHGMLQRLAEWFQDTVHLKWRVSGGYWLVAAFFTTLGAFLSFSWDQSEEGWQFSLALFAACLLLIQFMIWIDGKSQA